MVFPFVSYPAKRIPCGFAARGETFGRGTLWTNFECEGARKHSATLAWQAPLQSAVKRYAFFFPTQGYKKTISKTEDGRNLVPLCSSVARLPH